MGNTLGGKKTTKVMKINGETLKFKTPVRAGEIVKDYPGHVLLESEAVKHYGIRAKPLEVQQELKPKRLYFLVELPKEKGGPARRVRSGIHMSAKDRLENLMLSRRSISDLTIMRPTTSSAILEESEETSETTGGGTIRVKMRISKAEVTKLMMESKDEAEATQKIVDLYNLASNGGGHTGGGGGAPPKSYDKSLLDRQVHWNGGHERVRDGFKAREKRVSFPPINEGEIQLAVA